MKRLKFSYFARAIATLSGRLQRSCSRCCWLPRGARPARFFGYSDTWQLVITPRPPSSPSCGCSSSSTRKTATPSDPAQARRADRATQGAHNALLILEELEDKELAEYRKHYSRARLRREEKIRRGELDTDAPE